MKQKLIPFLVIAALAIAMPLCAQETFWTGGSTIDGNFNDAANWDIDPANSWRHVNKDGDDGSKIATITEDVTLNNLWVGDAGHIGLVNQTAGSITLNAWLQIGGAGLGQSVYNMTGGTLSTVTHPGAGWNAFVGPSAGSDGLLDMSGTSTFNSNSILFIGLNGGSGTVNVKGNAKLLASGSGADGLNIGDGNGSIGTLTVGDGTDNPTVRLAEIGGTGGWLRLGNGAGSSGKVTVNSGTVNLTRSAAVLIAPNGGAGEWDQLGGVTSTGTRQLYFCETLWDDPPTTIISPATGTLNLKGGVFATTYISPWGAGDSSTGTIKFDGGTLKANANNDNFINPVNATYNLNVMAGGAVIDSGGYAIAIQKPLVNGTGAGSDGGLTKKGFGSLALSGFSSYVGPTTVEKGALYVDGSGYLTSSGITVKRGAVLGGAASSSNYLPATTVESGGTVVAGSAANPIGNLRISSLALDNMSRVMVKSFTSTGNDNSIELASVPIVNSGKGIVAISVEDMNSLSISSTTTLMTWIGSDVASDFIPATDTIGSNTFTLSFAPGTMNGLLTPITINYMSTAGEYFTGTNWTGTVQQGASAVGLLRGAGAITVINTPTPGLTVGTLIFDNAGNAVTGNAITLNTTTAAYAQLAVVQGVHTVANNIAINNDLVANVNGAANSLTISGVLTEDATPRGIAVTGGGTFALSNAASTFSGPIAIDGSTFVTPHLSSPTINVNNGNLTYTGTAAYTASNGIVATGAAVTLNNAGNITVTPDKLVIASGTDFTQTGAGALNIMSNDLGVYSFGKKLTIGNGTWDITNSMIASTGAINLGTGAGVTMNMTLHGDAVFKSTSGTAYLGFNGGTFNLDMRDNSRIELAGSINFSRGSADSRATMKISDSAVLAINGGGIRFSNDDNTRCDLTMTGGTISTTTDLSFAYAKSTSASAPEHEYSISGGTMAVGTFLYFGPRNNSTIKAGKGIVSGGTITAGTGIYFAGYNSTNGLNSNINVDFSGNASLSAPTGFIRLANASGAVANVTMKDNSTMTSLIELAVGNATGGSGTLTMTVNSSATVTNGKLQVAYKGIGILNLGGSDTDTVRVSASTVELGSTNASTSTINLMKGSTLSTTKVYTLANTVSSTLNFDGGVLTAMASDTAVDPFINNNGLSTNCHLYVLDDGAKINTNGFNVSIPLPLEADAVSLGGGLVKSGGGLLTLSAQNTFTGPAIVAAGRLDLATVAGTALISNVQLQGGTWISTSQPNQFGPNSHITWTGGYAEFSLQGNNQTVAGISDASGNAYIEPSHDAIAVTGSAVLTVNTALGDDSIYNGTLRDAIGSLHTLSLTKSGSGVLTLNGPLTYTGNTEVAAGLLHVKTPGIVALTTLTGAGNFTVGDGVAATQLTLSGIANETGTTKINTLSSLELTATSGPNTLGAVTGGGSLSVATGVTLTATSIRVGSLSIGGAASAAAVPEPGTFVLLALAGMGALLAVYRRK